MITQESYSTLRSKEVLVMGLIEERERWITLIGQGVIRDKKDIQFIKEELHRRYYED